MRARTILDTIGDTPHVRIRRLYDPRCEVWYKLERANPGGSIKDRIALAMVEQAEREGRLRADGVIVEPTSGNTGIGLAMVAAVKGYRLVLVMPESMSVERRRIMVALGAELVLTPKEAGMTGAIARAREILAATPNGWMPMQFENAANVEVHLRTTVEEIARDFPEGFDAIVTGVGTGGHITACGRELKRRWPRLEVHAVEPSASTVLSGGTHSPHRIQGIGAGFVPAILDRSVLDGYIQVTEADAMEFARRAARLEGLFVGISSGATLAAIHQYTSAALARGETKRVLGFCYDTGERYLSIDGLFPAQ